ncbi:MAG: hypothetical protein K2K52_08380 [Paramuribaculum sp.]|nr:hypothetical protein [Paramuribaculum sp.]
MTKSLIISALSALTLSSCAVTQRTNTASTVPVDAKIYNVTVADLDVQEQRATSTSNWKWNLFSSFSLSKVKKNAEAELLKETGADVIVDPQYEVERRGALRGGSVTVSGYPARYTNFHSITPAEATAIMDEKNPASKEKCLLGISRLRISGPAVQPIKKPRIKLNADIIPRSFLNVLGGIYLHGDYYAVGSNYGLMYGHHGKTWGWYVKGSFSMLSDNHGYYRGEENSDVKSYNATFGLFKPFSNSFGIFAGAGVGYISDKEHEEGYYYDHYYDDYYDHYYYVYDFSGVSVPFELGFQFTVKKKFNILGGCTYSLNTSHTDRLYLTPFLGIGFSF